MPFLGITQTGAGGVGNASSNGLWLRADALTLSNLDPVTTWFDLSGNANQASSANTKRPLFISSSALNNMPALRFDGNDDSLTVADANIPDNS